MTSSLSVNSTTSSPISISGLASGLDTSSIIAALMQAEREPVTHLSGEESKISASKTELQSVQSSLQKLAQEASEFTLPSQFESSQTATSSESARVSAVAGAGAAIGGYEVEVTQLANAAQRTFTFTSPADEQTLEIEGQEFKLKAGGSAQELADAINSDSKATVYAAVLANGELVLSNRATGASAKAGEFIKVTDAGGALVEKEGTAKEGKDAEYKIDGTEGSSSSNTVTDAIPGVTLTLSSLTTAGAVTIDVGAPGLNTSTLESRMQSFIKLYNSTVEAIQKQIATKPIAKPEESSEYSTGTLFGDTEMTSLLDSMRATMYEPGKGLATTMSSPLDIGVSTGAATGSEGTSQAALEGQLTLDTGKFSEAVATNPAGVQKMLQQWSQGLQGLVEGVAGAGGTMEARINGDESQITQLTGQINNMNEMLAHREKALQETYAALESAISQNTEQGDWLTEYEEEQSKSG
jgi:flagellar hook-associated protein 2